MYLIFVVFDEAPSNGGRKFDFIRNLSWWNLYRDFFPARLIREEELDPTKNYVFGYHPHGMYIYYIV